jgi:hypothetical protein
MGAAASAPECSTPLLSRKKLIRRSRLSLTLRRRRHGAGRVLPPRTIRTSVQDGVPVTKSAIPSAFLVTGARRPCAGQLVRLFVIRIMELCVGGCAARNRTVGRVGGRLRHCGQRRQNRRHQYQLFHFASLICGFPSDNNVAGRRLPGKSDDGAKLDGLGHDPDRGKVEEIGTSLYGGSWPVWSPSRSPTRRHGLSGRS